MRMFALIYTLSVQVTNKFENMLRGGVKRC